MREVARSRNLLSGFVTTLKRLFESVMGTLFCLLLYQYHMNWNLCTPVSVSLALLAWTAKFTVGCVWIGYRLTVTTVVAPSED